MLKRFFVLFLLLIVAAAAYAQAAKPYVVEYYYKVKWGHQQEFLDLFKKNHYPLLKKQIEMGRIASVTVAKPQYHMSEDARWDYRVTITFKSAAAYYGEFDEQAVIKQLYPDQATYKREEQRRFEILDQHTDVPIEPVDMDSRP